MKYNNDGKKDTLLMISYQVNWNLLNKFCTINNEILMKYATQRYDIYTFSYKILAEFTHILFSLWKMNTTSLIVRYYSI